jgi:hypothetical protein
VLNQSHARTHVCTQGVKVWCDGKEYTPTPTAAAAAGSTDSADSGRACNEVLLPFAREECSTALVVSAQAPGVSDVANACKECVVLFKYFRYAFKLEFEIGGTCSVGLGALCIQQQVYMAGSKLHSKRR